MKGRDYLRAKPWVSKRGRDPERRETEPALARSLDHLRVRREGGKMGTDGKSGRDGGSRKPLSQSKPLKTE